MPDSMLAMIVPLGGVGGAPSHPIAPGGGYPSHPIAPGGGGGQPSHPIAGYPDNGLPGGGVAGTPEHPIVIPPAPDNSLPPSIWPGVPIHPETPEHPIELPPGHVWPPLPPSITGVALILVWVVSVGYRWIVVDVEPGRPDQGLPPSHARPGHDLPETPEPK